MIRYQNLPNGKKIPELGSGITGEKADFEKDLEQGLTQKDTEDIVDQTRNDVEKMSSRSESEFEHFMGQGTEPGEVFREFDLDHETEFSEQIQWDQVFRRQFGSAVNSNLLSARKKPSMAKRNPFQDEVDQTWTTQALVMGRVPQGLRIGIGFDVSGSMSKEFLTKGFRQVESVLRKIPGSSVDIYRMDTQIVDYFKNVRAIRPEHVVEGNGGTNLGYAMSEIQRKEPNGYDIFVMLTDGFTGEWPQMSEIPHIKKVLVGLVADDESVRSIIPKEYGVFVVGESKQIEHGGAVNRYKTRRY